MTGGLGQLFPVILLAAIVALVSAPLLARLARRLALVDLPGSAPHKRHENAVPLAGGPVLLLSVGVAYLSLALPSGSPLQGIGLGSVILLVWGLVDDRYRLRARLKLLGQLVATAVLVRFGVQVHITQTEWLDLALTVLWIVGLVNAFNFVDSMDGLALGLAAIGLSFFMLVTLDADQSELASLAAAGLGATLGLYFYNAAPASLFLGDSGSQVLGFILAGLGIAYVPAGAGLPQGVSWFTPILALGVPIFDTTLVVVSRLRRRQPIYAPQRDHTYHRLVAYGIHPGRAVLAMQLSAVLLGLVAFVALGLSVIAANLLFAAVVLGGLVCVLLLERRFVTE
jgi:UDP-GlcNAc:undecaprenyl-phosphate GlcNAc-1-phosphate transferase